MTRPTLAHPTLAPAALAYAAGALACCLVLASPARAETRQLLAAGHWTAYSGTDDQQKPVCGIATSGAEGRRIAIEQPQGETGLVMRLEKTSWAIPDNTPVDIALQIDANPTIPLQGEGSANHVAIGVGFAQSVELMRAIRAGRQIRVFFPSGNEPMWSGGLDGTSAVINAFNDCRAAMIPAAPATPAPLTQPFQPPAAQPAPAPQAPIQPTAPGQPAGPTPRL